MHLTVERLARIVESIVHELVGVSLSYSGEPLFNREMPAIINYLYARRICTTFPTNLSLPMKEAHAEALVAAGLDQMLISLDGASEESYLKYRVGGNFNLVVENVRKLADAKQRLRAKRPLLVWKMVIFPHNAHEIETVKNTWGDLGFDSIEFVNDGSSAETRALKARSNQKLVEKRRPCFWPWTMATIGWDGTVQPCCVQQNEILLGNAADQDIREIWRGEAYARLRSGFVRDHYAEAMHPVCRKCLGLAAA